MYQVFVTGMFIFCAPFMGMGEGSAWAKTIKPCLRVYTTPHFAKGVGLKAKALFEKKYEVLVEYVYYSGTFGKNSQAKSLLDRGDLIVGFAYESLLENEEDLKPFFAPSKPPEIQKNNALPLRWKNSYLTPISYTFLSFVYDSEKIKEEINSFEDLLKVKSKIILIDPRTSYPGVGLLLWVKAVYGDSAPFFWKRLRPQILTSTKSWSEAYTLFLQGEAPLVLSYSGSPVYHRVIEKTDHIRAASFKEGQYLQIFVAGILQNSKNKELSKMFLDFLLCEEIQKEVVYKDWSYPVIDIDEKLPSEFQKNKIKWIKIDYRDLMKKKKDLLEEWREAVS